MVTEEKLWMKTGEAAKALGMTQPTLRQIMKRSKMKAKTKKLDKRVRLVNVVAIRKLLEE